MKPTPISLSEFTEAEQSDPGYFAGRWRACYERCLEMCVPIDPNSVLEIGPYKLPLFRGSQTLDLRSEVNPTFIIDARETPDPIDNNAFDLVVALHVWEHFGDAQQDAIRKVTRITRYALLAFPYR